MPSQCYEALSVVILEAFAHGIPVLTSNLGSMAEVVDDGVTGLLFEAGNARDLASKANWLAAHPDERYRMGAGGASRLRGALHVRPRLRRTDDHLRGGSRACQVSRRLRRPRGACWACRVHAVEAGEAAERIVEWAAQSRAGAPGRYVCAANVHMTMEAHDDPDFAAVVEGADLVLPDGVPMVWALHALGLAQRRRVRIAPDLLYALFEMCESRGVEVGLYGGSPETLRVFTSWLAETHPCLRVACAIDPPFRPLTTAEDELFTRLIAESGAQLLLVGIGCPKQERWMAAHKDVLPCTMMGVGAAFDMLGRSNQGRTGLDARPGARVVVPSGQRAAPLVATLPRPQSALRRALRDAALEAAALVDRTADSGGPVAVEAEEASALYSTAGSSLGRPGTSQESSLRGERVPVREVVLDRDIRSPFELSDALLSRYYLRRAASVAALMLLDIAAVLLAALGGPPFWHLLGVHVYRIQPLGITATALVMVAVFSFQRLYGVRRYRHRVSRIAWSWFVVWLITAMLAVLSGDVMSGWSLITLWLTAAAVDTASSPRVRPDGRRRDRPEGPRHRARAVHRSGRGSRASKRR